jgi:hypothetical protein
MLAAATLVVGATAACGDHGGDRSGIETGQPDGSTGSGTTFAPAGGTATAPDGATRPPPPATVATVSTSPNAEGGSPDTATSSVPPVQDPSEASPSTPMARAIDLGPVPIPEGAPSRIVVMDTDGSIVVLSRDAPARLLVPGPEEPLHSSLGALDVDPAGRYVYFSLAGAGVVRVPVNGGQSKRLPPARSRSRG